MKPFEIYKDNNVRVTAILVNHPPMYPAFGFRFETPDGSIAFSGDTTENDNVVRLAKNADILVNEVIDPNWARNLFPRPLSAAHRAKLWHFFNSHTDIHVVGKQAEKAGVHMLVLSHLAPPTIDEMMVRKDVTGFHGKVVLGKPLMEFTLHRGHISERTARRSPRGL